MSLEAGLILILAMLIITLDFKVWGKIDRVVALMLREREEIKEEIKHIKEILNSKDEV